MQPSAVREFFTCSEYELDPEFRAMNVHLLRRGLLVVAAVEVGMTVLGFFVRSVNPHIDVNRIPPWIMPSFLLLGFIAWAASKFAPKEWLAFIASAIGILTSVSLTLMNVSAGPSTSGAYAILDIMVVLMVSVAVLPANFWQMLGFGLTIAGTYLTIASHTPRHGIIFPPAAVETPLLILVLLCACLSGANYRRMISMHRAQVLAVEAQIRQVQTDNAGSMASIAAALSHELNNPLGALKSSVSSLVMAAEKMSVNPEPRLVEVQRNLAKVALESAGRLEEIIRRMQRFSNLDRAEVQDVDLRSLVEDVAGLCLHRERLHLDVPELPLIIAQPHILSGAFAALLQKSTETDGDVFVSALVDDRGVQIHIRSTANLTTDPAFGEKDGRMASVNWEVFNARQLIRSQGGDLKSDGDGVVVTLPAATAPVT